MHKWPLAGAVLVVIGAWLGGKYHPAGFLVALVPLAAAAWIGLWRWSAAGRLAARRRRAIRARLETLRGEGFEPQLVLQGDLARGEAWAAFDFGKAQALIMTEEDARTVPLAHIDSVRVREWTSVGNPLPQYYSLLIRFVDGEVDIMAAGRPEAQRWGDALAGRGGIRLEAV
jgi:hypothetical protein